MSEHRRPVATVRDLETLDEAEIVEGYLDGFANEPCGDNRSRSYWHGWRNGMMDKGRIKHDAASRSLAHEIVSSGYHRRRARASGVTSERGGKDG